MLQREWLARPLWFSAPTAVWFVYTLDTRWTVAMIRIMQRGCVGWMDVAATTIPLYMGLVMQALSTAMPSE